MFREAPGSAGDQAAAGLLVPSTPQDNALCRVTGLSGRPVAAITRSAEEMAWVADASGWG